MSPQDEVGHWPRHWYNLMALEADEYSLHNYGLVWTVTSSKTWQQEKTSLLLSFDVQSLSRVRLCNPKGCSPPGFPVLHHLPELTQTHVHRVGDAIQPSHPLSSTSPAFNLSQHQGLFQWVSSSHQVTKVLEFQLLSFSPGLFLFLQTLVITIEERSNLGNY